MDASPAAIKRRRRRAQGKLCVLLSVAGLAGGLLSSPAGAGQRAGVTGASASAASPTAFVASAASSAALFAVGSPAMFQAEVIAVAYWGVPTVCSNNVDIAWAPLDVSVNATSTWWNPIVAYGNAAQNMQCKITLNQTEEFDWPMFCTVVVHEVGHLIGQQHSTDPNSVMSPTYTHPIAQCNGAPAGTSPPPVATLAAAALPQASSSHRAHSRHRKHHRHVAKRRA